MILYRAFAWSRRVQPDEPDGALWFPQVFQGEGRHDNPAVYACLYLADRPVSCVAEQLAAFRGQRLTAPMLRRRGLPLALADVEIDDGASILDLDEPAVLGREKLHPSQVATRHREVTQPQALTLYQRHPMLAGIRWWSMWESLWANYTLFGRARSSMRLVRVRELTLDEPAVVEASDLFGLRIV